MCLRIWKTLFAQTKKVSEKFCCWNFYEVIDWIWINKCIVNAWIEWIEGRGNYQTNTRWTPLLFFCNMFFSSRKIQTTSCLLATSEFKFLGGSGKYKSIFLAFNLTFLKYYFLQIKWVMHTLFLSSSPPICETDFELHSG